MDKVNNKIFSLFSQLNDVVSNLVLPDWLVAELQNKIVLFLNHVLAQQEELVRNKLVQHQNNIISLHWRQFFLVLKITPAGLLELVQHQQANADLKLYVSDESLQAIFSAVQNNQKPKLHIEGDVALARDISEVIEFIQWDFEDDLTKIFGDTIAHILAKFGRNLAKLLRDALALLPISTDS